MPGQGQAMPRRLGVRQGLRLTAVAVCLLALASGAAGVQYINDELLWMKAHWQEYRLAFPWSAAMKQRDAESTRQLQGPLAGFPANSMNGPVMESAALARLVEEDARRASAQDSSLDLTLLDEEANQELAAGVAQCKVCGALAKQLWAGLTAWVARRQQLPTRKRIAAYAAQLCEYEVPNEVLRDWVLLRARLQQGGGLPFVVPDGQGQEFYMLSKRTKQHASPPEIQAVRLACRNLLKDDFESDPHHILHQATTLLHQYHARLRQRLQGSAGSDSSTGGSGTGSSGTGRAEVVEAIDDGPQAERTCLDRHPQCKAWVNKGECESNRVYMLGSEGQEDGWCRAACGACKAAEPEPHGLSERDASELERVQSSLLAVLQSTACVASKACKWAAGEGSDALLAKAKKNADSEAARQLESAEFISGPISTEEQQMAAAMDTSRLRESRPVMVRGLNEAMVPHKEGKRSEEAPEPLDSELAKLLWRELGAKCVYASTGWWWYEICYSHHIEQFHVTDKHEVDWRISLGRFQPPSNWTVEATKMSGIYPHFTKVPYMSQHYTQGNHCDRDPHPETGQPRPPITRHTDLRLMCSPDKDMHIIVSEPDQCTYVIELYLPALCGHPGFAPEPPPGGWTPDDGTGGLQQEGSVYQLPPDTGDDDPYEDPDIYEGL
ncbi:OS-9 isoform X3 isoform B [Chlorella sorokiniana]|uniref:OS-9 isoform X3 isoform B n=1 Tax=Chlorella sorokiniana TaxID=3076 RepID=A0A2P6TE93_CHLSO|nr:OS-9 isoform X3 isoform B [Chlorella sorokiniana]|eukprot:PRW20961.1 OS-9 isoform X3 isoform B [Chlorella sorokiniana]